MRCILPRWQYIAEADLFGEVEMNLVPKSLSALCLVLTVAGAQDKAMFLHQPHIANGRIVFAYHGDIWVAQDDGTGPRRLTNHVGNDTNPRFSPDGTQVAFSSNRTGNADIYVMPIEGGTPRQLTFNTTGDTLANWTPDGEHILFASSRGTHPFLNPLYKVPVAGGVPVPLDVDQGATGAISQDGTKLAFNRNRIPTTRKHYRGNRQADIWVQDLQTEEITQLTDTDPKQHRSHVHEGDPMWGADGRIYYTSERSGVFNVWSIAPDGSGATQVTNHERDGAQAAAISPDGRQIIYENEFELWKLAVPGGEPERIEIRLAFEPKHNLIEFVTTENSADGFAASPDGDMVAVDYHGEIFLVPAAGGDKVQVTSSPWRDRFQKFSPDGKKIAYVTDASHEEEIWVYDLESREHRQLSRHESTKSGMTWSADSKKIVFVGSNEMVILDVATGENKSLAYNEDSGFNISQITEDGRWIVYSRNDADQNSDVYLYEVQTGNELNVTRHLARESNGQLTPDRRNLLFTSNRGGTNQLYVLPLQRRTFDPEDPANKDRKPAVTALVAGELRVDENGIDRRPRALPGTEGARSYFLDPEGKSVYFVLGGGGRGRGNRGGGAQTTERGMFAVDLDGKNRRKVADGSFGSLQPTADRKSVLFSEGGGIHKMTLKGGKKEQVAFDLRVKIDKRGEWEQVFEESWRSMKYRFYDPKMHGFDWDAMKARYKPILAYVGSNEDVNQLANEMIGELNASHVGVRGSVSVPMEQLYTTQLPGFEIAPADGKYRVTHVYRDGPADKEWIDLEVGDYVLAIDGTQINAGDNYWKILNETINDYIPVTVADTPAGATRVVRVKPVTSLRDIKYREWVQRNSEFVKRASGGRIAYAHIRSMNQASLTQFETDVDQNWTAKGMIIDIRYNGGGNIDEPLLDILERSPYAYINHRNSGPKAGRRHRQAIAGPKIMMINHRSGSDAEMTPAGFRVLGLGKIVGTPTAAGVIWTSSYGLMNGGSIRTPSLLAVKYDPTRPNNYGTNLENFGVEPDVWVENTPADELAGNDRELQAAVDEALRQLAEGGWQFSDGQEKRK